MFFFEGKKQKNKIEKVNKDNAVCWLFQQYYTNYQQGETKTFLFSLRILITIWPGLNLTWLTPSMQTPVMNSVPPLHWQPQVGFTDVVFSTVQQDVSLREGGKEGRKKRSKGSRMEGKATQRKIYKISGWILNVQTLKAVVLSNMRPSSWKHLNSVSLNISVTPELTEHTHTLRDTHAHGGVTCLVTLDGADMSRMGSSPVRSAACW